MSYLIEIFIGLIGAFLWETILRTPIIKLFSFIRAKQTWKKILSFSGDLYISKSVDYSARKRWLREADAVIELDIVSKFGSNVNLLHEDPLFDLTHPNTNIIIIGAIKYNKYAEMVQKHYSINFEYVVDSYETDPKHEIIKIISRYGDEYISSSDLRANKLPFAVDYGVLFCSRLKNNKKILWISGIHGIGTLGVYKYLRDNPDKFLNKINKLPKDGSFGMSWLFRIHYDLEKVDQESLESIQDVEIISESKQCHQRKIKYKPKIIICDLGNVIMLFDRFRTYRGFGHWFRLPYTHVATTIERSNLIDRYERGEFDDDEFYDVTMSLFNKVNKMPFELFREYWSDIFWPNINMINALKALKNEIKLVLLSNTNNLHFTNLKEHYSEIIAMFENRIILSYKEKMLKPDVRLFQKAIEVAQGEIGYTDCVYIDDNVENVRISRKLGMRGIVFYSYPQFVYFMRENGLYVP